LIVVGAINGINGRSIDDEAFVSAQSFINPGIVSRLTWPAKSEIKTEPSITQHRTADVKGIDSSEYDSKQVFVTSKDGTKVSVFLTHRNDTKLDGTAPAWLYFYGGFNIPLPPAFSATLMTWVASYGGVLVWVNARGGGGESMSSVVRRAWILRAFLF
jgi:prolyl oligopeptidase